jgi:hypothetical protein
MRQLNRRAFVGPVVLGITLQKSTQTPPVLKLSREIPRKGDAATQYVNDFYRLQERLAKRKRDRGRAR